MKTRLKTPEPHANTLKITPAPWSLSKDAEGVYTIHARTSETLGPKLQWVRIAEVSALDDQYGRIDDDEAHANARLASATANSFAAAGKQLGLNAVAFAERMQNGGIAELLEILEAVVEQHAHMR